MRYSISERTETTPSSVVTRTELISRAEIKEGFFFKRGGVSINSFVLWGTAPSAVEQRHALNLYTVGPQ
jgi:hypothetical protein